MLEHIDAELTGSREPVTDLHEMHLDSIYRVVESKLWPVKQSHEHSGDEADPSRSSKNRPRSLRTRDEQVPELRDGTRE